MFDPMMLEPTRRVLRRSPLGHARHAHPVEVAQAFRLAPAPIQARYTLRIREADQARIPAVVGFHLDIPINTFAVEGERVSSRLGPDEWLLHWPESEFGTLAVSMVQALGHITHALIDISQRHSALRLEGCRASDILNAGCPLDLATKMFPTGTATRTLLGKAEIILWRRADTPTYVIECGRSFAPYVWDFLVEAGREYR